MSHPADNPQVGDIWLASRSTLVVIGIEYEPPITWVVCQREYFDHLGDLYHIDTFKADVDTFHEVVQGLTCTRQGDST